MIVFVLPFYSLENIFSAFHASFFAFEIDNCHVICLSTHYLLVNKNKCRKERIISFIEYSRYIDEYPY